MVPYLRITIAMLFISINVTAANYNNNKRNYITKDQHAIDKHKYEPSADITNNNKENKRNNRNFEGHYKEYSKKNKKVHEIQLDVKNPGFKKLTLNLRKHKNKDSFKCKSNGKCKIGRTDKDRSNKVIKLKETKPKEKQIENHNDLNIGEHELRALNVMLNNFTQEEKTTNEKAGYNLRCKENDCASDKESSAKDDHDIHDSDKIENQDDNRINFKQEAIDDWTSFAKATEHCTKNHDCDKPNESITDKSKTKVLLRQMKEVPNHHKLLGYDIDLDLAYEEPVSLEAYDLMMMFERLKKAYINKVMKYIQIPNKRLSDLNLDIETTAKLEYLKLIYRVKKISEERLREILRDDLDTVENLSNHVLPHKLNNNAIYVSRDMFEDLIKQKYGEPKNEKADLILRIRNIFPKTKRQKMKLKTPVNFQHFNTFG